MQDLPQSYQSCCSLQETRLEIYELERAAQSRSGDMKNKPCRKLNWRHNANHDYSLIFPDESQMQTSKHEVSTKPQFRDNPPVNTPAEEINPVLYYFDEQLRGCFGS